jgi:DNA cross-link repair 1A protein
MAGSYAKKAATPSKTSSGPKQSSTKRNSSILSFFQKTDTPPGATSRQARITQFTTASLRSPSSGRSTPASRRNGIRDDNPDGLFLEDKKGLDKIERASGTNERERSTTPDFWGDDEELRKPDEQRYNENNSAVKRRKVDSPSVSVDESPQREPDTKTHKPLAPAKIQKMSGPFIDESDSEDDMEAYREIEDTTPATTTEKNSKSLPGENTAAPERSSEPTTPLLVRAATSNAEYDEYPNFDDLDEEDELIGEEFRNRPWEGENQEQEVELEVEPGDDVNDCSGIEDLGGELSTCPICQIALKGFNETVGCHSFLLGLLKH